MFRAILVYACAACGLAQEVTLLPRFKAGDRFRLELTRTREDSRRPQANGTGRTPVDVANGVGGRGRAGGPPVLHKDTAALIQQLIEDRTKQ